MKKNGDSIRTDKGFTLIEVITSLVIISIFGIIFVSFFQTQIAGSTKSVIDVQQGFALEEVMEKIKADYEFLLNSDATPLITLQANIVDPSSPYGVYTAVTKFIEFDASENEAVAACTVDCTNLKITITIGDQTLTTVFSQ